MMLQSAAARKIFKARLKAPLSGQVFYIMVTVPCPGVPLLSNTAAGVTRKPGWNGS